MSAAPLRLSSHATMAPPVPSAIMLVKLSASPPCMRNDWNPGALETAMPPGQAVAPVLVKRCASKSDEVPLLSSQAMIAPLVPSGTIRGVNRPLVVPPTTTPTPSPAHSGAPAPLHLCAKIASVAVRRSVHEKITPVPPSLAILGQTWLPVAAQIGAP